MDEGYKLCNTKDKHRIEQYKKKKKGGDRLKHVLF